MEFIRSYYKKGDLFKLFLACVFPIHVWAIIMFLRDFNWISERTNSWDAVGVGGYAMLLALVESIAVFIVIFILGFLVHRTWNSETRLSVMSTLIFIIAMWAIFTQGFFLLGGMLPESIFQFLVDSGHPFRYLYGTIGAAVIITVALPVYLLLRVEKFVQGTMILLDRIAMLSGLYLFFDFVGIIIVIIRNV